MLPTRHKVGFLTPGQLTSPPTLPWARGALSVVPMPGSRQRGPADAGLAVWALSAVLIRPPRPCSPSGRRVRQVSLQLPAKASSSSSGGPPGSLDLAPGAPRVPPPLSRPRAANLPSPPPRHPRHPGPAHGPSPPAPGPSPPPYLSRPLSSPLLLVRQFRSRCWVFTPGGSPGPPFGAPEPPEPRPHRPAASKQLMAPQPGRALRNPGRS